MSSGAYEDLCPPLFGEESPRKNMSGLRTAHRTQMTATGWIPGNLFPFCASDKMMCVYSLLKLRR